MEFSTSMQAVSANSLPSTSIVSSGIQGYHDYNNQYQNAAAYNQYYNASSSFNETSSNLSKNYYYENNSYNVDYSCNPTANKAEFDQVCSSYYTASEQWTYEPRTKSPITQYGNDVYSNQQQEPNFNGYNYQVTSVVNNITTETSTSSNISSSDLAIQNEICNTNSWHYGASISCYSTPEQNNRHLFSDSISTIQEKDTQMLTYATKQNLPSGLNTFNYSNDIYRSNDFDPKIAFNYNNNQNSCSPLNESNYQAGYSSTFNVSSVSSSASEHHFDKKSNYYEICKICENNSIDPIVRGDVCYNCKNVYNTAHAEALKKEKLLYLNDKSIKIKPSSNKRGKVKKSKLRKTSSSYRNTNVQITNTCNNVPFTLPTKLDKLQISPRFNYETYILNEFANSDLVKTNQTALLNTIKTTILNKKNSIKDLFLSQNEIFGDPTSRYENFKSILQNHLFSLTKSLMKLIISTIDSNDHADAMQLQDSDDEVNLTIDMNIMNLLSTNNKSLLFAYCFLVENLSDSASVIPENDYEIQYKLFKKSLNRIYNELNASQTINVYNNDDHQHHFGTYNSFCEHVTAYNNSSHHANIQCSIDELKMLHFILLLFSKFINHEFEFSLLNSSLQNIIKKLIVEKASYAVLVQTACLKITSKLIEQLCINKTIKTKILLNISNID